ncbi:MAG TPA: PQQ-binding-like beta-propeller repeat protein [Bryobacteraceae bacterium]|jgi:PQQ-dependent dehydrogenase (methanol/ethanol family)
MTKRITLVFLLAGPLLAQSQFAEYCSGCHGADAHGSAKAPGLANDPRIAAQSADQLRAYIQHGNPNAGMPAFTSLSSTDLNALTRFLLRLNKDTIFGPPPSDDAAAKITLGPPQPGDWRTYNGSDSGNRYSLLKQITTANVAALKLKWIYPLTYFGLETTPIAADGVLYVTGQNTVVALDAITGNTIWSYSRPQSLGMVGDAALGTNRGVGLLGDKVFFLTDNAHLIAFNRANGKIVWEVNIAPEMPAEEHQHYGGTLAPLIVHDTVVVGVAGADEGIRGFVAAFRATDGSLAWRRWTVPRKGEPGIETWRATEPITGGGSTWLTGSYDPTTDMIYWPVGNPWPDSDDRDRPGDNLYTDSVLALNAETGDVKWYYQFTPHDRKDRDATEPDVLVDTTWRGQPRKLLLHANRNGFFYVLDRTNGKLLLAKPFLRRVDWASSVGPDGRPVVVNETACPSDAANWDSTAFSPLTHLYYVLALEECTGIPTGYPNQTGQRYLRALNIDTGDITWEIPQPGPARAKTWSGVLATAGGLVFYGHPNGGFAAVDQRTGKSLWEFPTNVRMKASPMTFSVGGKQYVAVAAGPNILCFGL